MFDVIDFLESVGQDAQLRYASSEQVIASLAGQSIDSKLRDAILAKDVQGLGAMLGKEPFCCYIDIPAEEYEFSKNKDDEDDMDEGDMEKVKRRSSKYPQE